MPSRGHAPSPLKLRIALTREDADLLLGVAHYYEKSMGPMRFVVSFTATTMRTRYRFIAEEGKWLERFAHSIREEMDSAGQNESMIDFTPRATVAFWGRLLASVMSKRSRRRLSDDEAARRQTLADKLRDSLAKYGKQHHDVVNAEIATRRLPEQEWMLEALG